ncbi:acyl-CoA dehydrogenase family protein [Ferrimicrobium acidiphilum]|uniref:acyl-CoA dehydrogenase family protein n=1 Tax=Ferrimicrobium acidiphilum TaxID=121039 RepID=UPI001B808AD7|nr:acyl-CoA dehydrogenase family protein [Ferrimicrobium acidiphilum]
MIVKEFSDQANDRFGLNEREKAHQASIRALARDSLVPLCERADDGRVNRDLVSEMGRLGLLEYLFPKVEGDGYQGSSKALELCLIREALAYVSTECETAFALQGLGGYPILRYGARKVQDTWIPAITSGSAVAAFALSEAGAGSDAGSLALHAVPDGQGWRLTGEKTWISNAPEADVYTVFARTETGAGPRGITAFAVPGQRKGLSGTHIDLLAPHPIGSLVFEGVRVEEHEMLGEFNQGFQVAMRTLDLFRPSVGAFAIGMGQAGLEEAIKYSSTRMAFGNSLVSLQSVSHSLAKMAMNLEAARLLVYRAAIAYDMGLERSEVTKMSAMAKLYATEAAQDVIDHAVQICGARGLVRGHLLEHLLREVRATRIYEGASEVQLDIISRSLMSVVDSGATGIPSD